MILYLEKEEDWFIQPWLTETPWVRIIIKEWKWSWKLNNCIYPTEENPDITGLVAYTIFYPV